MMRVMMKIEYNEEDDHEEGDDEDDDGDYERKAETKSEWWGHSYLLLPTNRWLAWLLGGGRGFALRAYIQFLTFDNDANIDQFLKETGQNWLGHFYDSWGVAEILPSAFLFSFWTTNFDRNLDRIVESILFFTTSIFLFQIIH